LKLAIKDFKNLEKEVKYSVLTNHENLVTLYRTLIRNKCIYFIQDYCAFGSVHDIICAIDKFSYGLPTSVVLHVLYGVASGLNYLHNSGFIHRSLEGQHVLISFDGSVKLSGFRYITELKRGKKFDYPKTNDSTRLNFLAPEILSQNSSGYDQRSDVYSLGILVCYLCNGIIPFSEFVSPARMFLEKITGARPYLFDSSTALYLSKNKPEKIPDAFFSKTHSPQLHLLTRDLLATTPEARPDLNFLLEPNNPDFTLFTDFGILDQSKTKSEIHRQIWPAEPVYACNKSLASLEVLESIDVPSFEIQTQKCSV